jgi:hypothetical protein
MTKKKLLRDGMLVGFERSNGTVIWRSYDNFIWTENLVIPYDDEKDFLNFDQDNLVEIYEE